MKTFPTRPAHVPEPPRGYVFLGHRRDIKVPESWDKEYSPSYGDRLSFAAYSADGTLRWIEWDGIRAHKHFDGYIAAKPNTPLYNLNIKENPMPTHTPKTLKYEVVERQNGFVAAKITEQSHRQINFGAVGDTFGKLSSVTRPQNRIGDFLDKFFVRGDDGERDDNLMLFTDSQFKEFEKEVAAYNSHFATPPILKTVFFEYSAGSVRGYRRVEVIREDETYLEGIDSKKGSYRKFLKSKIVGPVDTVKA